MWEKLGFVERKYGQVQIYQFVFCRYSKNSIDKTCKVNNNWKMDWHVEVKYKLNQHFLSSVRKFPSSRCNSQQIPMAIKKTRRPFWDTDNFLDTGRGVSEASKVSNEWTVSEKCTCTRIIQKLCFGQDENYFLYKLRRRSQYLLI